MVGLASNALGIDAGNARMPRMSILVLNGPGLADGGVAGLALSDVQEACDVLSGSLGVDIDCRQTDDARELARWIGELGDRRDDGGDVCALVINPCAASHAESFDREMCCAALQRLGDQPVPMFEVHFTNIFATGAPLQPLQPKGVNLGLICGLGVDSYLTAIRASVNKS